MKNVYKVLDDTTIVYVKYKNQILECMIDTEDLELVNSISGTWTADKHHTGRFYIRGPLKGKKVTMHRFIMKPERNLVVDHINHNTIDNRKSNLRVITNAENKQNLSGARSDSESGVRGVKRSPYNTWYSQIVLNGKTIFLGSFKTKKEAIDAVKVARAKYMPYSQEALANIS